jgi:UDP-glucuronate decarboxylase
MSYTKIILITGGCGFIGSNLIELLLRDNSNLVLCIDNLITGSESNIQEYLLKPNFRFMCWDICDKVDLLIEWIGSKLDQIYHLASLASPVKYKTYPIETLLTSINGTQRVIDLCRYYTCKMLFTSTSEVYGDPLVHPQPEEYWGNVNTVGERSCYDEGKRVCETLIYEYRRLYELDLKIVRLFNTYGPKMALDDGRVITNFIGRILKGQAVQIYGSGEQTRSFCFIDDILEGLIAMIESSELGPINLGNDSSEFTLNELVGVFERVLGKEILVEYLSCTADDPKVRKPVISKARVKLGFECSIGLEEGIRKTCYWFSLE